MSKYAKTHIYINKINNYNIMFRTQLKVYYYNNCIRIPIIYNQCRTYL